MNRKFLSAAPIFLLFLLVSCGSDNVETFRAPLDQNNAGVIARCLEAAEVRDLALTFGGQYRVLNEKHRYFEIFGVPKETIKAKHPNAKLENNKFYYQLVTHKGVGIKTIDSPFAGPDIPTYRANSDYSRFPHLAQIGRDQVDISIAGEGITIAIIDTGVSYNHPHLSPNILLNAQDKHGDEANDIDEDGNGFKDDYVGWDFVNGDAYPIDDHGHGTHVAGLAAGTLSGVAHKAKILPVKVLNGNGSGDMASIVAGILYATERGAKVINLSLGAGGDLFEEDLKELVSGIQVAADNGALIISAAGNGGSDGVGDCNDSDPIYPANIPNEHVVSVAAVDEDNQLTSYSNFGPTTVDIAAPGGSGGSFGLNSTGIYDDTSFGPTYRFMSGTSMATPVVSGLVAVMMGRAPYLSAKEIKQALLEHGTFSDKLQKAILSGSVVNILESVNALP